ncbi:MAG: transcription termination/antitermination protein NusG, partial [Oscillospiraceae bacterium]|nr:transcription termination/antitermination protein NusG [Oscillospiraceae bacterium]
MADSEAKWYILHTYSGYENKVAADITKLVENRNLQNLIEEAIVPTITRTVEKENGETVEVEDKVYPGYVFVKMVETNESWYICRNTRGVTGFVGPEGKPTPLSEEEVRELEHGRKETPISFEVGDRVTIKQGVLEGFEGEIAEIAAERKLAVVNVN